jgi:o-succinylbenzoate---CoA ligase
MSSFYKISPGRLAQQPAPPSEYFERALDFCRAWEAGEQRFVRHTSGSTGTPKAIILNCSQLQASAKATQQALGLQANQTALICLNIEAIAGTMMLVRGMEIGMEMYIVAPSANPLANLPDNTVLDFAAFVPLQLQTMLQNGLGERLDTFQTIIVGGAAVSESLLRQIASLQVPVFSTYGMTETVSHVALRRLNGPTASDYYRLLPQIEANTDDRGCLRLCGAVTNHQWIQTNDLVQFVDKQTFQIVGRADNSINSGGIKIQLEKVEAAIDKLALLENTRFFAWHKPDETLGQKLVLVIEQLPKNVDSLNPSTLKTALSGHLNKYEIPREVYFSEKFIETATGKIDKHATFAGINCPT